jgi:cyclophilin family peptidyl-prolyl cis-trans isomerase/HEAT repeat protein
LTFIFFTSCSQNNDEAIIKEIRLLEFHRTGDPEIFNNFLKNEKETITITVIDAIAKIGNPVFAPVLKQLLSDKSSNVISKTIFALGEIGAQDSLLISLLDLPSYTPYYKNIIFALGQSRDQKVIAELLSRLSSFTDTLKTVVIQNITFIAPPNYNNRHTATIIGGYLDAADENVRGAAAYYFSRHPHTSVFHALIRSPLQSGTIQDKYRFKALSNILKNYYIQNRDSAIIDTLKDYVVQNLDNTNIPWQQKIYSLDIYSFLEDSNSLNLAEKYLGSENPHIRIAAINLFSKSDSLKARQALIKTYQNATWADKGRIILALSKKDPDMVYSLIQRNLDKGNLFFKQLLLRSLAKIKSRMALNQLRQFLQVPNPRLNYTAYKELWDLRYIGYKQTKPFLLSADIALTSIATDWIIEHPEWANFEDLSEAFASFKEPVDVEVMTVLVKAVSVIKTNQATDFLLDLLQRTNSIVLAKELQSILKMRQESVAPRSDLKPNLFIPDTLYIQNTTIEAEIETEKGSILITLFPDVAPLTVSNFIYLANKGFYNHLSFHRVVSDFVIQGGDPRGDGWGGPGYAIPCEYNEKCFKRGTIGMATAGKDTGSSQFFICHSEQPHLNRRYTVFGEVKSGMDIVDKIEIDDIIKQIIIKK